MVILDTTTRKGKEMLINMNPKADGTIHAGWRISYTHVDGGTNETDYCYHRQGDYEDYWKRCAGIAKVDCVGVMVYHDSLCNDLGEIPENDFYRKDGEPRRFKYSREA